MLRTDFNISSNIIKRIGLAGLHAYLFTAMLFKSTVKKWQVNFIAC
jgi:hypothetical protein